LTEITVVYNIFRIARAYRIWYLSHVYESNYETYTVRRSNGDVFRVSRGRDSCERRDVDRCDRCSTVHDVLDQTHTS